MAVEEDDSVPVPNDLQPKEVYPGFGAAAPLARHQDMQFFEGLGLGASDAWLRTRQRWTALSDDPEQNRVLDATEQKNMFGDRPLGLMDGMTLGEAQRKIQLHDHQTWQGALSPGLGYTLGGLPPSLLDPVSVGSMVVGGPLANAAVKGFVATRGLLAASSINLAADTVATGAASIPLEMAFSRIGQGEDKSFGEATSEAFGPEALAMGAALGGLHLSAKAVHTAMVGFHFDYTIADVEQAAARGGYADRPPSVDMATQISRDPSVPPPPVGIPPREVAPKARLQDMFDEYVGGVGQWVRDLNDGLASAVEHAKKLGVDVDSPPMREFIDRTMADTRVTHQNTPEAAEAVLDGKTPAGVAPEAPTEKAPASVAPKVTGPKALTPQPAAVIHGKPRYGLLGKTFKIGFASQVDKALYMSRNTPQAREWLAENGMTPTQITAAAKRVRGELRARVLQADKEGRLDVALPETHVLPQQTARREFIKRGGPPPSHPAQFSTQDLISAIESSRIMQPHDPLPEPGITPDAAALQSLADPPDLVDLMNAAQRSGVDVQELRSVMDAITREMAQCRP